MNWSPKNVVLVMFAGGWLVFGLVALVKGQTPPAPPVQILPLLEAPYYGTAAAAPYYGAGAPGAYDADRDVVERERVEQRRRGTPRAARVTPPPPDHVPMPVYDPDFGTLGVSPGDQCYGQNCRVQSLTGTPAVLFANLPTCDASKIGQMRYTSDQGWVQCSGTAPWTGFGGSGSDTCTGNNCAIGPGGITTDGGILSTGTIHSLQSGPGTIAFQCDDQISSSSPCLANGSDPGAPARTLEIFSFQDYPNDGGGEGILAPNILFSARPSPIDGGVRQEGYIFSVLNNETAVWGVDYVGNMDIRRQGGAAAIRMWGVGTNNKITAMNGQPVALTNAAGVSPVVYIFSEVGQAATDDTLSIYNGGASVDVYDVTNQGFQRNHGVATGSLVACNAGNKGLFGFDSTVARFAFCTGAAWVYFGDESRTEELWSANCITCNTDINFMNPVRDPVAKTVGRVECAWETAGTVGSTNATIQVYNVTDSTSICTCAIGACNTTARTPLSCTCGGTIPASKSVAVRFSGKGDCTAAPQVTGCTVHLTP